MDLSDYKEIKPHRNKRIVWVILNMTIIKCLPGRMFWWLRKAILRMFGAKIDKKAYIYASCKIYAPWNLKVGRACVGPNTELYNKAYISIGNDSVVSQGSYLCTASHSTDSTMLPLKTSSITIGNYVWVAADAFVGMGVTIGEGAVVGARAAVFKDVEPWTVVGGNPAKYLKQRVIKNEMERM